MPFIRRIGIIDDKQAHRIRWHDHSGLEVHYMIRGLSVWEVHGRSEPISVPGGAFVCIPSDVRHRAIGENAAPSSKLGIIYDKASLIPPSGVSFGQSDLEELFRTLRGGAFAVHAIPSGLLSLLKELRNEVEGFDIADGGLRLRILNELLLVETARSMKEGGRILPRGDAVVPQVCRWIKSHLGDDFSIADLVRLSGYGRSRFFSLFFAETGMSPNDYVVRMRVDRAQALIRKRRCNILEVALACGFKSAATFSSTFRKFTGVSPRIFRSQLGP